ncbi:hypothetical protein AMELA_G00174570, partial [Ameiurus melas]
MSSRRIFNLIFLTLFLYHTLVLTIMYFWWYRYRLLDFWDCDIPKRKRSDSPDPMKSDESMDPPLTCKNGDSSSVHSKLQRKRSDSPEPSCVSMKSDASMDPPHN